MEWNEREERNEEEKGGKEVKGKERLLQILSKPTVVVIDLLDIYEIIW